MYPHLSLISFHIIQDFLRLLVEACPPLWFRLKHLNIVRLNILQTSHSSCLQDLRASNFTSDAAADQNVMCLVKHLTKILQRELH